MHLRLFLAWPSALDEGPLLEALGGEPSPPPAPRAAFLAAAWREPPAPAAPGAWHKGRPWRGWPQRGPVAGTLEAAASGLYGGDVVTLQHVGIAMTKNLIQEQVGPCTLGAA